MSEYYDEISISFKLILTINKMVFRLIFINNKKPKLSSAIKIWNLLINYYVLRTHSLHPIKKCAIIYVEMFWYVCFVIINEYHFQETTSAVKTYLFHPIQCAVVNHLVFMNTRKAHRTFPWNFTWVSFCTTEKHLNTKHTANTFQSMFILSFGSKIVGEITRYISHMCYF